MYAASREALRADAFCAEQCPGLRVVQERQLPLRLRPVSELFSVVEALDGQRTLRSALADASAPAAGRERSGGAVLRRKGRRRGARDRQGRCRPGLVCGTATWSTRSSCSDAKLCSAPQPIRTSSTPSRTSCSVSAASWQATRSLEQTLSDRRFPATAKRELLVALALRQGHRGHRGAAGTGRRPASKSAPADAFDELSDLAAAQRDTEPLLTFAARRR